MKEKIAKMGSYIKSTRVGKMFKGVSPGGEEFIVKLDKITKGKERPNFLTGTIQDVIKQGTNKPLFLYLSGDDNISRQFET